MTESPRGAEVGPIALSGSVCNSDTHFEGLRVALVGPLPPPAGGMANQTRQLAELLGREGATVELVQVNAPYRPVWVGQLRGVRAVARLLPYLASLWAACGRAHLVHVMANSGWSWDLYAAPAVWIARMRGVPALVNYRGGEAAAFLEGAERRVRATVGRSAGLLFPSGFLLDVFRRHGMSGRIVPNIVDLERFYPSGEARVGGGRPQVLIARNLEAIYGIATAIKAFAAIRPNFPYARLVVAGSGPQEAELRALAARLGLSQCIEFTGRLDREQMAAHYRNADLMLNPSRVDNTPNSVLEALASGCPVVSTNVGGVPYLVEDGRTALLVERDDPEAMAAAILRMLTDSELRDRLVREGLQEVRRYTWSSVRSVLLAAYRDARESRS